MEDRPRRGRPRTSVTAEVEAEVRRTLEEEPPRGTHWSTRLMAEAAGLHHSQVARIWRAPARLTRIACLVLPRRGR
ncbi:helix-turn-helix domain-containing protein [Candidatus Palauibacter sp.]|uniref:helix-turn-helix domain-containing protein n=1 Tax=Candidatus Palauibacter sp. TaxID=3101350 RepID=UPI003CC590F0